jgi:methylated-DNA-[protein]-cysteine S-methyltransferase
METKMGKPALSQGESTGLPILQVSHIQTALGVISVTAAAGVIKGLHWREVDGAPSALTNEAVAQLEAYFARKLTRFDLPLDWGTGLHAQVRHAMAAIPLGETRTYGDLSRALGSPAQAIGQACGANPIPIIIPCHRILSSTGLGGFSAKGGVETKVWLLKHEGAASLLL